MATLSTNTPSGVIATGLPIAPHLDHRPLPAPRATALLTPVEEFSTLMEQRRRIDRRLSELTPAVERALGVAGQKGGRR